MKVTTSQPETGFQPFNLTITVETKRELEYLACFFNQSNIGILEIINSSLYDDIEKFNKNELNHDSIWVKLHDKLKNQ